MTFDYTQEAFRAAPTNETAANYLHQALICRRVDVWFSDDKPFVSAVAEIAYWLKFGEQIQ